jgi:hypothetical protein
MQVFDSSKLSLGDQIFIGNIWVYARTRVKIFRKAILVHTQHVNLYVKIWVAMFKQATILMHD